MTYSDGYAAGVLDSNTRLYKDAIIVYSRATTIKEKLLLSYGGRIEPTRWVVKSKPRRRKLLLDWQRITRERGDDIQRALDALDAEAAISPIVL